MGGIEQAPDFAKRLRSATREAPFAGTGVPNYFRKPYGPGWALVGDAGYNNAGTISPTEFFAPENVEAIFRCGLEGSEGERVATVAARSTQ